MRPSLRVALMKSSRPRNSSGGSCSSGSPADERFLDAGELGVVAAVDAGHHVEDDVRAGGEQPDRAGGALETAGPAAHPVVVVEEPVQAHGRAAQPARDEAVQALFRQGEAVGDHPPGEALVVDGAAAGFEVGAHQRLAARHDHEHGMRGAAAVDAVQHAQEVRKGHVRGLGDGLAVAAAVAAGEVAAQRALPEKLLQRVLPPDVALQRTVDFERQPVAQIQSVHPFRRRGCDPSAI